MGAHRPAAELRYLPLIIVAFRFRPRWRICRPCSGYIRDDAVEVTDDDDMHQVSLSRNRSLRWRAHSLPATVLLAGCNFGVQLFSHGFYGYGTVSRRKGNRAMVMPPDVLTRWMAAQAQQVLTKTASLMERDGSRGGAAAPERLLTTATPLQQVADALRTGVSAVAAESTATTSGVGAGAGAGASAGEAEPAAKRRRMEGNATGDNASSAAEGAEVDGSMAEAPADGSAPPSDPLTLLALHCEHGMLSAPLPNAFQAAAAATAHGHDALTFDTARAIAHYVCCPPPRMRHVADMMKAARAQEAATGAEEDTAAAVEASAAASAENQPSGSSAPIMSDVTDATGDRVASIDAALQQGGVAGHKRSRPAAELDAQEQQQQQQVQQRPQYVRAAFETTIVEAEAAVYLALRAPGKLIVYPPAARVTLQPGYAGEGAAAAATASSNPLPLLPPLPPPMPAAALWRHFCSRISNFPARAAVYAHCRDKGYVVREGHAFGADFVLYSSGPGQGHSLYCVVIMPLQIRYESRGDTTPSAPVVIAEDPGPDQATSAEPTPIVLAPACDPYTSAAAVAGTWLQVHAHSRVIGQVRKEMLMAYTTLTLPGSPPARPTVLHPAEGGARAPVYCPSIASQLADPAVLSQLSVTMTQQSRWLMTLEHNKKSDALLTRVAAAIMDTGVGEHAMATATTASSSSEGSGAASAAAPKARPLNKQERQQLMKQALAAQSAAKRAVAAAAAVRVIVHAFVLTPQADEPLHLRDIRSDRISVEAAHIISSVHGSVKDSSSNATLSAGQADGSSAASAAAIAALAAVEPSESHVSLLTAAKETLRASSASASPSRDAGVADGTGAPAGRWYCERQHWGTR